MMHDAAMLLQIENAQLLALYDLSVPLRDFPEDVVPLIAHIDEDLDPGEPRRLALADIEAMVTLMKRITSLHLLLIALCTHFLPLLIAVAYF